MWKVKQYVTRAQLTLGISKSNTPETVVMEFIKPPTHPCLIGASMIQDFSSIAAFISQVDMWLDWSLIEFADPPASLDKAR